MTPETKEFLVWILFAFGVVLALGLLAALSFGAGMLSQRLTDRESESVADMWAEGLGVVAALLFLIFLLVGFVRFSWYAWA
jgi:uncharacterized membrane protein YhaH (DUF805 family)